MFDYRPYTTDDLNFIQSSWGSSYYKGQEFHLWMSPQTFHHYHRPIRDQILSRPTLAIIICCSKLDPDQIIGWIAVEAIPDVEQMIVHYLYVKKIYKGEGIAQDLFNRAVITRPVFFSHMTDRGNKILLKKGNGDYLYVPHLI